MKWVGVGDSNLIGLCGAVELHQSSLYSALTTVSHECNTIADRLPFTVKQLTNTHLFAYLSREKDEKWHAWIEEQGAGGKGCVKMAEVDEK